MSLSAILNGAISVLKLTGIYDKFANMLGGGKSEAVAKKIVTVAQDATGATSIDELLEFAKDPELQAEIRKAILDHELDLYQLALADVADARDMQQSALGQSDGVAKRFIYYFAWYWSVITCIYIGCITFADIPKENIRFADLVLGFLLGTIIATIVQFLYGSMLKPHGSE